jgi:hypothetical protein
LPARLQTATTVLVNLAPIGKSAPLAKSAGQAPACHRVAVKASATMAKKAAD